MADKKRKTRLALLEEFEAAPPSALFTQSTIAALRCCSTGNIERDKMVRQGGSVHQNRSRYPLSQIGLPRVGGATQGCTLHG
jgi:hypothetical protein